LLQDFDLLRLSDPQTVRGAAEAQLIGDGDEVTQVP